MSAVKGNPEEIKVFSATLARYAEHLREETAQVDSAFAQLGETWQDHKRAEFEDSLNELKNAVGKFEDVADQQVSYLKDLAQRLEEYLNA